LLKRKPLLNGTPRKGGEKALKDSKPYISIHFLSGGTPLSLVAKASGCRTTFFFLLGREIKSSAKKKEKASTKKKSVVGVNSLKREWKRCACSDRKIPGANPGGWNYDYIMDIL